MSSRFIKERGRSGLRRLRTGVVLVATALAALALAMPAVAAEETPEPSDPTATATTSADESAPGDAEEGPGDEQATPAPEEVTASGEVDSQPSSEPSAASGDGTAPLPLKTAGLQAAQAGDWPPGWLPDPALPDGLHFGFNPDLYIPGSIQDLKQMPETDCAPPALPDPTRPGDGSGKGYTVPIRIRLSDGVILGGYSDRAGFRDQPVPFTIQTGGMSGWVVGLVSLPSLRFEVVDPEHDVRLCDFDRAAGSGPVAKSFEPYPLAFVEDQIEQYVSSGGTLPDPNNFNTVVPFKGTSIVPWPGALGLRLMGLDNLGLKDAVAQQVEIGVSGLAADGSLQLATQLKADVRADPKPLPNGQPNTSFQCDIKVSGTFGTAAKERVVATPPTLPDPGQTSGFFTPAVPARQDKVYLPTKPLTGAIEGGRATIGSNWFDVAIPDPGGPTRCGTTVNAIFYGFGFSGGVDIANWGSATYIPPVGGVPIVPGLVDLSLDVTVDHVGLPKYDDLSATNYGFD